MSEIRSLWNELDHKLSNSILTKLENSYNEYSNPMGGLQQMLSLRLVSKPWKEAAAQYTGKMVVEPQDQSDLHNLRSILPNITELHVNSKSSEYKSEYIQPVSAFTQLSSLSYTKTLSMEVGLPLDMSFLPATLVELNLNNCRVNPSSFFNNLPRLQKFTVHDLSAFLYTMDPEFDLSTYLRSSSLTDLSFDMGWLLHLPQLPVIATALRRLRLDHVGTNAETLRAICNLLPSLTQLKISASTYCGNAMQTISAPATGLRSLEVVAAHPIFIQLAGADLVSLKCRPLEGKEDEEMPERTVTAISNLTALTQLTLYSYRGATRLSALQGLQLKKLRLEGCPGAAQQILGNGGMTSLQKLHIWESKHDPTHDVTAFNTALGDTASADHQWAQELYQLGQVVLSLPNLVQVSGSSLLFTGAMAEGLRAWREWRSDPMFSDCWYWKKLT